MFISILSLSLKHNYCYYTWAYYDILIIMGIYTRTFQKINNIWLDRYLTNGRSSLRKLTTPV